MKSPDSIDQVIFSDGLSDIEETAAEIKTLLDEIRDDVRADLDTITTDLSKAAES